MFENKKISFIGTGNMSEAIIRGLLGNGVVEAAQIVGSNPLAERNQRMSDQYGIGVRISNLEAIADADVVVLGVKPQYFAAVSAEIDKQIPASALVVSIMAGVTIATMSDALSHAAIARSMPNTPAMIGQGMTVWTTTPSVTETQQAQAQAIFAALGAEIAVADEKYLDMATAMSGSGPGYIFLLIEAMIDAGVQIGFARDISKQLVLQTMIGSAEYARQSDAHVTVLRNQVTSPGGTTAAGLAALERGNIRSTLADGIRAAYEQAGALGKKDGG